MSEHEPSTQGEGAEPSASESLAAGDHSSAKGLPDLAGGWEIQRIELPGDSDGGAREVRLYVPIAPELLLDDEVVQERNRFNDSMPYWAWLWDSAPTMARCLVEAGVGRGSGPILGPISGPVRVLEIGAGLGLVGLALAACTGCSVVLTDRDPLALETLNAQIQLGGAATVSAASLDWNELDDLSEELARERFDVIVGCDVIYEGGAHSPLLALLDRMLAVGGEAWFADPRRTRRQKFIERASRAGYAVEVHDESGITELPESGTFLLLRVFRIPSEG